MLVHAVYSSQAPGSDVGINVAKNRAHGMWVHISRCDYLLTRHFEYFEIAQEARASDVNDHLVQIFLLALFHSCIQEYLQKSVIFKGHD
jgi:hypothetical protein